MFLRNAFNQFRLNRAGYAISLIVVCFGGIFCAAADLALCYMEKRELHLVEHFIVVMGLIVLIVFTAFFNRQSIAFDTKHYRGKSALASGDLALGEKWLREALTCADGFALDDPRRGETLHELAHVAHRQGHYDDAEIFAQQAAHATDRSWGPDHPKAAHAVEFLAEIYCAIARYAQAKPLLEEAIRRRETIAQPIDLAKSLNSAGEFWLDLERPDKAEPHLRRALDLVKQYLIPNAHQRLPIVINLCEACTDLQKLDEAEQLAHEAMALAHKIRRPHSWSIASSLYQLADVRRAQGRPVEAEEIVRRAIAIIEEIRTSTSAVCHDELHLLGDVLRAQGRWAEAEECYLKTLSFRDEYLAPEDLATARILEDYAELLELMNRGEEAHAFEHRAKQIREFHSPFRIV